MVRAQERIEDLPSTSSVGQTGADSDARADSEELSKEGIQILKLVAESKDAREAGRTPDTCDNNCVNHKMEWGFCLPSCHLKRGVEGEGENTVSNSEMVTISSKINKDKGNDSTSKEAVETYKDGDGFPAIHKDIATDELPDNFSVEIDESYTIQEGVEYNWVPSKCMTCKVFGHSDIHCLVEKARIFDQEYAQMQQKMQKQQNPLVSDKQQIPIVEKVNKVWKAKGKEGIHANGVEEGNSFAPLANTSTNEHPLPLDKELAQPEKENAKTKEQLDDDVDAITQKTPIGGDYVDEGFQLSKSTLKRQRKKNNKSEKAMRADVFEEPPSRQTYFNCQGMELEASSSAKSKSSIASGRDVTVMALHYWLIWSKLSMAVFVAFYLLAGEFLMSESVRDDSSLLSLPLRGEISVCEGRTLSHHITSKKDPAPQVFGHNTLHEQVGAFFFGSDIVLAIKMSAY
ncbi:hypothetical protein GIB67_029376 [Kingdonia uniflora]|uniref:Uncharacterized protein n=1 Tax=Kingdonia uniflora TaxID=39325 RepID=A0A7J7P9G9_9MAGN|nr:hypothetical protein GIB67_029376 [Kingdonia uniflora]